MFDAETHAPDPDGEQRRKSELLRRLKSLQNSLAYRHGAVETAIVMIERGIQLPDVAEALGLQAVIPRAPPRRRKPWKIRSGTDAEIVANLLDANLRRGWTSDELVKELQKRGRLASAKNPRRALRWTLDNLRKRTKAITERRGKWYAQNHLGHFRAAASISKKIKT